jgi:hypothetical protein
MPWPPSTMILPSTGPWRTDHAQCRQAAGHQPRHHIHPPSHSAGQADCTEVSQHAKAGSRQGQRNRAKRPGNATSGRIPSSSPPKSHASLRHFQGLTGTSLLRPIHEVLALNETTFDWIVYIDSDTYFTNASRIDFQQFLPLTSEDRVVACPTPWSLADDKGLPITWNGGFFIMQPSSTKFQTLINSHATPAHFATRYGPDKQWFDVSEMGTFMRDFPRFLLPYPAWEYCADVQFCCVEPRCETRSTMPKSKEVMVHGLKPYGPLQPGLPLSTIFDRATLDFFSMQGYDARCLKVAFYEPLTQL